MYFSKQHISPFYSSDLRRKSIDMIKENPPLFSDQSCIFCPLVMFDVTITAKIYYVISAFYTVAICTTLCYMATIYDPFLVFVRLLKFSKLLLLWFSFVVYMSLEF